ncbi:protein SEH1-like isoform X2 [Aristolochia californica]|uniref:protein SEH1-like isoform X2 n=1 Tax=Aristolochia californica TaxID=171875 RepID=UPI0035DD7E19
MRWLVFVQMERCLCGKKLKKVTVYSDGHVMVYELLDPLELNKWQFQAEFQNVIDSVSRFVNPSCSSASIAWKPRRGANHQSSFALGFNSDLPQFNSSKVWQLEWDMGGMTLASAGSDGMVRLWLANLKGVWQEQATLTSGEGS